MGAAEYDFARGRAQKSRHGRRLLPRIRSPILGRVSPLRRACARRARMTTAGPPGSGDTPDPLGATDAIAREWSAGDSAYAVKLPIFEGPLDLLLHLIRIDEVDITDIPIARIAEQY